MPGVRPGFLGEDYQHRGHFWRYMIAAVIFATILLDLEH